MTKVFVSSGNVIPLYNNFGLYNSSQKEFELLQSKMPKVEIGHEKTPACLLQCAKWVLDVSECPVYETHFNEG